jgi:hypothetical protein
LVGDRTLDVAADDDEEASCHLFRYPAHRHYESCVVAVGACLAETMEEVPSDL